MGVTVGPTDANPWDLQVSSDVEEWGVTPEAAKMRLELVESVLGAEHNLVLDFVKFNMVPFELYEDEVTQFCRGDAVVGISFDYQRLVSLSAERTEFHLTRHVARLTPYLGEEDRVPNIRSPEFVFDYSGDIWLFDDSGEMGNPGSVVNWRHLVSASRMVDGGLWVVRRP